MMYAACANILAHHPAPAPRHLRTRRLAFAMAGVAVLEVRACVCACGMHQGVQHVTALLMAQLKPGQRGSPLDL